MRRLGIMGGTFDPIHDGHLVAAQEAASALGLEKVLFVPAGDPPHKVGEPLTPAEHRVAMVGRAIANNSTFELCTIELERDGPSYTIDTLYELRDIYPSGEMYFIVGMDSLHDLPTWRAADAILEMATLVAVYRAGWKLVDVQQLTSSIPGAAERVRILPIPGLDISSTDLRARVAAGRPIRYLVPDEVVSYIGDHGLYLT